jgi:hypothetical protein
MLPIIGTLIETGVSLFKSYFPPDLTPEQKAKLEEGEQAFKTALTTSIIEYSKVELEQQASIVRAEAQGESYLQKNWRPLTMMTFVVIIANNFILFPYLQLFFKTGTMLDIPPDMWDLLKIGLGGYVVGRSVEKSVKVYSENKGS